MATARTTKKTPPRERLSRETIVASALALADAEGLDAVTIRRVATDHKVTPMALYWHFADKERLLDGIAEAMLAQVRLPGPDPAASWDEELRAVLGALLDMLRAHPEAADLVKTRILMSQPGLEISDRALGLLRQGGFSAEQAGRLGHHALCSMVLLVATEPGRQVGADRETHEQLLRTKKAHLSALPPDRYPNVVAAAGTLSGCEQEPEYFELGLELFIQGVRSLSS